MSRQRVNPPGHTSFIQVFITYRDLASDIDHRCILHVQDSAHGFSKMKNLVENGDDSSATIGRFNVPFCFQKEQRMKLVVFECDAEDDEPLSEHNVVAEGECTLCQLAVNGTWKIPVRRDKSKSARVEMVAREDPTSKMRVALSFSANNLEDKDFFSKSDPFLKISKLGHAGKEVEVLTTEVVQDNLDPTWKPISVPMHLLCDGSEETPLKIQCFDHDGEGVEAEFIGEIHTTLAHLRKNKGKPMALINPRKTDKRGYKNSGTLTLTQYEASPEPSLLDYILGGTQISVVVAIDFTYSNMDPKSPRSKHHLGNNGPNQYELAMEAALDILQHYDHDKKYYMLGFGAILNRNEGVNHDFFLPGEQPCEGIKGALIAYKKTFSHIEDLSQPTHFSGVINHTIKMANRARGDQYFILLILTDGNLSDMKETKEAIVKASSLPISIIIVGIGDDDFTKVRDLDCDKRLLKTEDGRRAEKDIVQFVSYKEIPTGAADGGRYHLTQKMLEEIPEQFMSYMKNHRIRPGPRDTAF